MLVPPGDAPALAVAILALLGDPARRRALAAAGLAQARRHSWDRLADRWAAIYMQPGLPGPAEKL
jgi:phenylacetate-CoA ligase